MIRKAAIIVAAWPCIALAAASASGEGSCPDCFAVLVMPDTQHYTETSAQPVGGRTLRAITRFACEQRAAWNEPGTDHTMPIRMLVHLGDLVQNAWAGAGRPGGVAERQWQRVDAAFDTLDGCGLPYLVVLGNHDGDQQRGRFATHTQRTDGFDRWFGAPCMEDGALPCAADAPAPRPAWLRGRCLHPPDCVLPEYWYLGNGSDIAPRSRHVGHGNPGPEAARPGRHRAGLIATPAGGRMLVIGLDYGLDWGLPAPAGDDLAWVERLFDRFPATPTILVHHTFGNDGHGGLGTLVSSRGEGAARDAWQRLVVPHPQVAMTLTGHWLKPKAHDQTRIVGDPPRAVHSLFRNFQSNQHFGWITMLVFDPARGELRVRSHRIAPGEGDDPPTIAAHDFLCPPDAAPGDAHCATVLSWPPRVP